jgi:hypothetical protein
MSIRGIWQENIVESELEKKASSTRDHSSSLILRTHCTGPLYSNINGDQYSNRGYTFPLENTSESRVHGARLVPLDRDAHHSVYSFHDYLVTRPACERESNEERSLPPQ